jgi:phosphatidylinositol alpha-mannosyltransferase
LKDHLRSLGVADRIVFTGFLSDADIAAAMHASDIALVPHTQATNSYSVMLPVSYGRPVLASDLACFREMAVRGDCLELFTCGDLHDFRRALTALLDSPHRCRQLSDNARRYADRFAWPRVAQMTRDIYRVTLESSHHRGHAA